MINLTYRYMYLVSVLGKEGVGGEDLKWNVSSQLWVLMLCVVQLIMQTLPFKIFLGRCLKWYFYYYSGTCVNTATDSNKSSVSNFFVFREPFNMLLLLIQSDFCCLVVTRLTGFHCNLKLSMSVGCFFRIFVPHGGKTEFELTHITKFSYILKVI